jgi:heme exporter protein A
MIEASKIRKSYGRAVVLAEVSLAVKSAECVLLLGPNGAGKTTLLRILATVLRPNSGSLVVNGADAIRQPAQARAAIGMVGHGSYVYEDLTGLENLRFWATMHGGDAGRARLEAALAHVGLDSFGEERVRTYSAGMKRRLALARVALIGPRVLLLDEPFTGLDAEGRTWVAEFLRAFKARGGAAVLVTHSFGAALEVSDRVAILTGGQLVADRPCADLSSDELNKLYSGLTEGENLSRPGGAR